MLSPQVRLRWPGRDVDMTNERLPLGTQMGPVALGVPSLETSMRSCADVLGLAPKSRPQGKVDLRSGDKVLVTLLHDPARGLCRLA